MNIYMNLTRWESTYLLALKKMIRTFIFNRMSNYVIQLTKRREIQMRGRAPQSTVCGGSSHVSLAMIAMP